MLFSVNYIQGFSDKFEQFSTSSRTTLVQQNCDFMHSEIGLETGMTFVAHK